MKRCRVQKYDPAVTVPPLQFITVGEFECEQPEDDYLGENFYIILGSKCAELGFVLKSYSFSTDDNFDYDVTVR